MAREGLRYQLFSRRAFMVAGAQFLGFAALGARLYYLGVVQGDEYRVRADKNRVSLRLIPPVRGRILDARARELATNRQDFRVFLVPEQAGNVALTLDRLGRIVQLDDRDTARLLRQIKRQRRFLPVTVAQGLNWETFSRVNVSIPELPGVVPDSGMSRAYPAGPSVAHLVGYLSTAGEDEIGDNPLYQLPGFKIGRQGLERQYETRLRGTAGTRRVEVNSVGREIRELPGRQEATPGEDIHLSVDLELQNLAAEVMGEHSAGAVVIDIRTGEIVTLASSPSFDPNDFALGISQANWSALMNDQRKPLLNKCLTGQYPPGSTFKSVVALAALEAGVITEETEFFCNGRHPLGDHVFHCHLRRGHGRVNVTQALSKSCDVFFYNVAHKLDIDKIAEMARHFGLGHTLDIGLEGEKPGLVPDRAWKRAVLGQRWNLGETLNVSIGQGAMLTTPLQLAVMTARLASGRLVEPTLEQRPFGGDFMFGTLPVKPENLALVRRGLEMVTEVGGTAHDYSRGKGKAKLAGKTGTAQVRRITRAERLTGVIKNEDLPWEMRDHALYIAYGPVEAPTYAAGILVEHGSSGSKVAAPIARALIDRAIELENGTVPREGEEVAAVPAMLRPQGEVS